METKNIVATLYLKDGKAVRSFKDFTEIEDVYQLCQMYNDSGIDKIIIFDLSTDDDEHEKNINTIKQINRNLEIKVCPLPKCPKQDRATTAAAPLKVRQPGTGSKATAPAPYFCPSTSLPRQNDRS